MICVLVRECVCINQVCFFMCECVFVEYVLCDGEGLICQ